MAIRSSRSDVVLGNQIGGNEGDGVMLIRARKATIGGNSTGPGSQAAGGQGNRIVVNQGYGLLALGACNGSGVQGNTIAANAVGDVNITHSGGITPIPKGGN